MENEAIEFLHFAAEGGTGDLEKTLKHEKNWTSIVDSRGRSAIFYSAISDNVKNCQLLAKSSSSRGTVDKKPFRKGQSWWSRDSENCTPLHWAVQAGSIKVIKYYLQNFPRDANGTSAYLVRDKDGVTPLHLAAKRSSAKILKMFVDVIPKGENIFKLGKDGQERSPLHYAAGYASIECCQMIIDSENLGLPIDQRDKYLLTPLMCAATVDLPQAVEVVRLLAGRKFVSVSLRNCDGQTALHLAVAANNLRVVAVLLNEVKAQVECFDIEGRTPLHYAADAGHDEAVEYLLRAGARNTTRDKYEVTPSHYAAQKGQNALRQLLVNTKQRSMGSTWNESSSSTLPDVKDKEQRSCLMWAVIAGNLEAIEFLLSATAPDRQEQDIYGMTALHLAAMMGDEHICKALVKQGWNVNERTKTDTTALHLAAGRANTEVVRYLVTAGANLNDKDSMQRTPIFMACFGGQAHNLNVMVKELGFEWRIVDDKGWRVPVRDAFNRTVLHAAAFAGYSACITTILNIEDDDTECGLNAFRPLVHWKDLEGETALHVACAQGKTDCVITLISRGAHVSAVDGNFRTPLEHAVEGRKNNESQSRAYDTIIELLKDNYALKRGGMIKWAAAITLQRYFRTKLQKEETDTNYWTLDYPALKANLERNRKATSLL